MVDTTAVMVGTVAMDEEEDGRTELHHPFEYATL